jgi:hypothetical protein
VGVGVKVGVKVGVGVATPQVRASTLAHHVPHLLSLPPTVGDADSLAYSSMVQKLQSPVGSAIVWL